MNFEDFLVTKNLDSFDNFTKMTQGAVLGYWLSYIIRIVRDLSTKNCFVFIVNTNNRKTLTMPCGYGKIKTKRLKKQQKPW